MKTEDKLNVISNSSEKLRLLNQEPFIGELLKIINNSAIHLDKRHKISELFECIDESQTPSEVKKILLEVIFHPQSKLYKLLKEAKCLKQIHLVAKKEPLFSVLINELKAKSDPCLKIIQESSNFSLNRACEAARSGDLSVLSESFLFGINLNGADEWFGCGGMETILGPLTPLAIAAGHGHKECVKFLLETIKGIEVNGLSGRQRDYTPLDCLRGWMKGTENEKSSIAELLKSHGGFSARIHKVYKAALAGDINKLKDVICEAKHKNININDPGLRSNVSYYWKDQFQYHNPLTPLAVAVFEGHYDVVHFLLNETTGIDVNAKSGKNYDYTPLDFALVFCPEDKKNQMIDLLKSKGAIANRMASEYHDNNQSTQLTRLVRSISCS